MGLVNIYIYSSVAWSMGAQQDMAGVEQDRAVWCKYNNMIIMTQSRQGILNGVIKHRGGPNCRAGQAMAALGRGGRARAWARALLYVDI